MRRLIVALFIVLLISAPAFAQIVNTATGLGAVIKDNNQNQNTNTFLPVNTNTAVNTNTNANTNLNTNTNVNTNTNLNTNLNSNIQGQNQNQGQMQGQQQGQVQGQLQGQIANNDQVIAPSQSVSFRSPTQLLAPPSQGFSEINFGSGKIIDVTKSMPNFAIYGIKKYNGEPIREILSVSADVKFKRYFKVVLSDAKDIATADGFRADEVRIIVACAEAQKSYTIGLNVGGAGSGLPTSGLGGGSGAGSLGPQWGGTKADDLFTIFYVKVATPTSVVLYEKKSEVKASLMDEMKTTSTPASVESRGWFKF